MENNIIDLGFVEECEEAWRLESRFFPSKIGGKPAWLDLKNIPDAKQLACDYCEEPCIFLCQIYAPYEDEKAFHRTIYVFICKNPDCCKENCSGNVKVLRSQLEQANEFYPPDPPVEEPNWREDLGVDKWLKVCSVCGIFSSSHCSKCKKVNYCCRSHQIWDWKNGHKESCGTSNCSAFEKFLYPQLELVIEREDYDEKDNVNSEEELEKFVELVKSGQAGTLQSEKDIDTYLNDTSIQMANVEDKTFSKFKKRIKSNPDQVIRYNVGGDPLLISSKNQPENISKCEECGGDRQYEFQVMPQLLVYLKIENILNSIDWGILAIYTCKNSCIPQSKYIKEYVWKQDVAKEQSNDE